MHTRITWKVFIVATAAGEGGLTPVLQGGGGQTSQISERRGSDPLVTPQCSKFPPGGLLRGYSPLPGPAGLTMGLDKAYRIWSIKNPREYASYFIRTTWKAKASQAMRLHFSCQSLPAEAYFRYEATPAATHSKLSKMSEPWRPPMLQRQQNGNNPHKECKALPLYWVNVPISSWCKSGWKRPVKP